MYPNDDVSYAFNRLVGTIVRYKDKAVQVDNVVFRTHDAPLQVCAYTLREGAYVEDTINNFNLVPVSLGWVNHDRERIAEYYTRMPVRQDWRQGLRPFNTRCFNDGTGRAMRIGEFDKAALCKTIEGEFPSIEYIIKKLHGRIAACKMAWCRDFAINGDMEVLYKMYGRVGNFKDGLILLDEKFTWVDESLKEVY